MLDRNSKGETGMADIVNLKERIHRGELIFGVGAQLYFSRGQLEDLLAQGDYSFVYVDSQHVWAMRNRSGKLLRARRIAGDTRPVSDPTHAPHLSDRPFSRPGPSGIMVPEVEDGAEVDEAIRYFYYAQVGRRSSGGVARRNLSAFGEPTNPASIDRLAYADWWNSNGFLAIQLESVEAVINARKLAKRASICWRSGRTTCVSAWRVCRIVRLRQWTSVFGMCWSRCGTVRFR